MGEGLPAAAFAGTAAGSRLFMIHHDKLNSVLKNTAVYRNLLVMPVKRLRATNAELGPFCA